MLRIVISIIEFFSGGTTHNIMDWLYPCTQWRILLYSRASEAGSYHLTLSPVAHKKGVCGLGPDVKAWIRKVLDRVEPPVGA
jgi:hypothetical protein